MSTPYDTIKAAILGAPYDAAKKPSRQGTVRAFAEMQVQLEGAQAGALVKDTLAALTALTSVSEASIMAWVTNDATQANNGIYENTGTDISPVWARRIDIPQFVISGVNVGAGTANAIQATTDLPIPVQDGRTLIILPIVADNTGPATIAFNGGSVLPILSIASDPLIAGNLLNGMFVSGFINSGNFTLITDVNSAASAATAAAAEAAAVISAAASLVSETNAAVSAAAALVSETNAAVSAADALANAVAGNLSGLDLAAGAGLQVAVNTAGDGLEFVDIVTFYKGVDVASATDLPIGANDTFAIVTGTTTIETIESIDDAQPLGSILTLRFLDSLQLTHSANLILQGNGSSNQNIVTKTNDIATFVKWSSGVWSLVSFKPHNVITPVRGTFTATLTGCVSNPTVTAEYFVHGNMVTIFIPEIKSTSNTNTMTITGMPLFLNSQLIDTPITQQLQLVVDDGTEYAGLAVVINDVIYFSRALSLSLEIFTTSGVKGINGTTLTFCNVKN